MRHSLSQRLSCFAASLVVLAAGASAHAEAPAQKPPSQGGAHPYEGHVFPLCSKPAATGAESFDAHYTVGREAFEHGEHGEALKQFVLAYDADCKRHEILVIVSRAYEGDQNYADAARVLDLYLTRVPDAPAAAGIRERITKLREKARVQAEEKSRALAQQPKTESAPAAPVPTTDSSSAAASRGQPSIVPWLVVGAGGAVFLAGAITMVAAATSLPEGCNFGFPNSHCDDAKNIPEAERSRPATFVSLTMMGVGLATIATGLVLHFVDKPAAATARTKPGWRVLPMFGSGSAGMALATSM
ncbi:MAG: hypothetical protein U0174_07490 [Polyangiaceae bacterium]